MVSQRVLPRRRHRFELSYFLRTSRSRARIVRMFFPVSWFSFLARHVTFMPCSFVPEVRSRVLPTSSPLARFVSHAILPSVRPHVRFLPFHAPLFLAAVLMSLPGATLVAFVVTLAFLFRLPCTFLWLPTCAMRTGCFPDARDTSMSHAWSSTSKRNQKRRRNATCDGAAPPKQAAGRHGGDALGPVADEDR